MTESDRDQYIDGMGARTTDRRRRLYGYGARNSMLSDFIMTDRSTLNVHPVVRGAFQWTLEAVIVRPPTAEEIALDKLKDDILARLEEAIKDVLKDHVTPETKYQIFVESKDGTRRFSIKMAEFQELNALLKAKFDTGDYDNTSNKEIESTILPHQGLKVTIMVTGQPRQAVGAVGAEGEQDMMNDPEHHPERGKKKKRRRGTRQKLSMMDTDHILLKKSVHIVRNRGSDDKMCATRALVYQAALLQHEGQLPRHVPESDGRYKFLSLFGENAEFPDIVNSANPEAPDIEGQIAARMCAELGISTNEPVGEPELDLLANFTGFIINIIEPNSNCFRRQGTNKNKKDGYHMCASAAYVSSNAREGTSEDIIPVFLLRTGQHVHLITDIYSFFWRPHCNLLPEECPGPHAECGGYKWCCYHGRLETQKGQARDHDSENRDKMQRSILADCEAEEEDEEEEKEEQVQQGYNQQQRILTGEEAYLKREFGRYACKLCKQVVITRNHVCTVHPKRLEDEEISDDPTNAGAKPKFLRRQIKCLSPSTIMVDMDFECMLLPPDEHGRRFHVVNLAKMYAPKLSSKFYTATSIQEVVNLLLNDLPKQADAAEIFNPETGKTNFVIRMHNGGGYDFNFIIREMNRRGEILSNFLSRERRIITFSLVKPTFELEFKDTFNMLPVPLADMQSAMGLKGDFQKGDFPHFFNTPENQNYIGKWPDLSYYSQDEKMGKKRCGIDQFYAEHKDKVFDFKKEFHAYCEQDVLIQAAGANEFSNICSTIIERECKKHNITYEQGLCDPWCYNTIAGFSQVMFEAFFIPRTPKDFEENNWPPLLNSQQKSKIISSRKEKMWLKHLNIPGMQFQAQVPMVPMTDEDNERKYLNVDGFVPASNPTPEMKGTVYEFYGDFYHGNPETQNNPAAVWRALKVLKMTPQNLYQATIYREEWLKYSGYEVVSIWESKWDELTKKMPKEDFAKLTDYIQEIEITGPMDPRDALFGGRTEAFYMFLNTAAKNAENTNLVPDSTSADWKIAYADVCSEYPTVMAKRNYPVGSDPVFEPSISPEEVVSRIVDQKRLGIVKCKVRAPPDLLIPVLPVREAPEEQMFDDREMPGKPATKTSSSKKSNKPTKLVFRLGELTGTWTSVDLLDAIKFKYEILEVYDSVWFKSSRDDLFKEYVATFFKLKTEASGLDEIPPNMTLEEYDQQFQAQFPGYSLDLEYMQGLGHGNRNDGLRYIAKLFLNSLWGRYGMNHSKYTKKEFVDSANGFLALIYDPNIEVISWLDCISDSAILVEYQVLNQASEQDQTTSLAIAAFTTAYGRSLLYSYIAKCIQEGGIPLYCDTDSLVYAYDKSKRPNPEVPPLQYGSKLGDLSDELKGDFGTEFVSIGAKTYSVKTSKGKSDKFRAKGVEMDAAASKLLHHQAFVDLVKKKVSEILVPQNRVADKTDDFRVYSRKFQKSVRITFNKRKPIFPLITAAAQLAEIGSVPFNYQM
jgi:hypothetical protein